MAKRARPNGKDTISRAMSRLGALMLAASVPATSLAAQEQAHKLTGMWMVREEDFIKRETPDLTAEGKALKAQHEADLAAGKVISDASRNCLPIGSGTMMVGEFPFEILETPGRITIVSEKSTLVRTIYLNRTEPTEGLPPMWNGYSTGKWDDEVLKVKTTNFNDRLFPLGFGGLVHAPTTTMREQLSLSEDGQTLTNVLTFEDQRYLKSPHTIVRHYERLPDDSELWEYVCEVGEE